MALSTSSPSNKSSAEGSEDANLLLTLPGLVPLRGMRGSFFSSFLGCVFSFSATGMSNKSSSSLPLSSSASLATIRAGAATRRAGEGEGGGGEGVDGALLLLTAAAVFLRDAGGGASSPLKRRATTLIATSASPICVNLLLFSISPACRPIEVSVTGSAAAVELATSTGGSFAFFFRNLVRRDAAVFDAVVAEAAAASTTPPLAAQAGCGSTTPTLKANSPAESTSVAAVLPNHARVVSSSC
jgi:hypothetical protein